MNGQHAYSVALSKIGNPEGFSIFAWEILDDGNRLFRMAKELDKDDEGFPQWDDSTDRAVIVTDAEEKEEFDRYERETGKCGECLGTQKTFKSWDHKEGTKYRTCPRCNGSGLKHKQEIMPI